MFVSHDNKSKKKFQKPNILRRKPKAAIKTNVPEMCVQSDSHPLVTLASQETNMLVDNYTVYNTDKSFQIDDIPNKPPQKLKLDNVLCANVTNKLPVTDIDFVMDDISGNNLNLNNNEEDPGAVNVESFFNNGVTEQDNVLLFNLDTEKDLNVVVVIDDEHREKSMYTEHNQDIINNMVPLSSVSSIKHHSPQEVLPAPTVVVPEQHLFQQLIATPVKFKCDSPNCNKEFRSEQKLKKHKNIHNKEGGAAPRQITVECPVKRINPDGTEQPCGKIYLVRELLVKHLNEDHTLEDAAYRCEVCSRRFFWASGLRAHARSHWAGAGSGSTAVATLACAWPGCGRQFRQPCRLREHARAHTGDRPYPCRYPNCGWSFRSASKLERHARRHTGKRRHSCTVCGRAFLRRDHLRDHSARYHSAPNTDSTTPTAAPKSARPVRHKNYHCTHEGCKQAFSNMSSLYMHTKKVHRQPENDTTTTVTTDTTSLLKNNWDYIFLTVDGITETGAEKEEDAGTQSEVEGEQGPGLVLGTAHEVGEPAEVVEAHAEAAGAALGTDGGAARTHRPWPLQPRVTRAYVLEEDASSVEPSESSENNIYTVRSDLFLHGNVLINEDSEHMGGVAEVCAIAEADAEADAVADERTDDTLGELGLLDTHPTIDLMQEELMYTVWQ